MAGAEAEPMDRRPGTQLARGGGRVSRWASPPRQVRQRLCHGDLRVVAEVRGLLRDGLCRWGVQCLTDTAELLTSELVTNALVHTARDAVFTATLSGPPARLRLRVEVYDFATPHPEARVANDQAANGRGLLIVRMMADDWGVTSQPVGKTVWFELVPPFPERG